jgi:flagellar assembly protein FliH
MSARILRRGGKGGAARDALPIQWRVQGQASAAAPSRGGAAQGGGSAPPQVESEREAEARAAAYRQGVAAGEAASAQRAQASLEPAHEAFQRMAAELAGMRKNLRTEAEGAAVTLALAVARRVLHREIVADPEAVLGLVKAASEKCAARETQRLRVSPRDAETIFEHRSRLNLPPGLEIVADANLERGSAIFETSRGDLDASVDTQLAEIERGFADVLKRRHS